MREVDIRIFCLSLGCRLNQAEMSALARALIDQGHEEVAEAKAADLVVFNTCAVTAEAERKGRQLLRRLRRENPRAQILVTGCYAELDPTLAGGDAVATRVLDNAAKRALIAQPERTISPGSGRSPLSGRRGRTRALVRVQEGCDNRCAYCVVWRLRGPQVSRPAADILDEVIGLVGEGRQEVVLTGVHTGAYGRDGSAPGVEDLSALVRLLLERASAARLRLSSIEPWDLASLDLTLWNDPRLCRHLHVPLQSGSDTVLGRMGRRYSAAEYEKLIGQLRDAIPDLAVTTDVIAGFPGETDADHEDTLRLARSCGFARMHVFPYSERPHTAAAQMPDQVPVELRRRRASELRLLAGELRHTFETGLLGRTLDVLWERRHQGRWQGLTSNYVSVRTECGADLRNTITPTVLRDWEDGSLTGTIGRCLSERAVE